MSLGRVLPGPRLPGLRPGQAAPPASPRRCGEAGRRRPLPARAAAAALQAAQDGSRRQHLPPPPPRLCNPDR